MRCSTIGERFQGFLRDPTSDHYQSVRERILDHPDYDPYDTNFQHALELFRAGKFELVLRLCPSLEAVWQLSPRFHYIRGVSLQESGQASAARWEQRVSRICLNALLHTGTGSVDAPFLITYLSDSYDILMALGMEPVGQRLLDLGDQRLDVVIAADDSELCFDVTELLMRARSASGSSPPSHPVSWLV